MTSRKNPSIEAAFGQVVRSARESIGISQEALADRASLHRTFVSQIERGVKSPSLDSMRRLSIGVGVSLDEMLRRTLLIAQCHAGKARA